MSVYFFLFFLHIPHNQRLQAVTSHDDNGAANRRAVWRNLLKLSNLTHDFVIKCLNWCDHLRGKRFMLKNFLTVQVECFVH
jgi:hypothetical protein